jgi:integrase
LADARSLHDDCKQAARTKGDPQGVVDAYWAQRRPKAQIGTSGPTVGDVIKEFLTVASRQRKRPEQAEYLLNANVAPKLGDRPVASIRKRDIIDVLEPIVKRGSLVLANRVQALLKQAFMVAADRDLIENVPSFPRAPIGGDEAIRTRVLTEDEIVILWKGLDKLSTGTEPQILRPLALALKLQLVTAQRRGEIADARWDQIAEETRTTDDREEVLSTWTIPTSPKRKRAKEYIPHPVPLSPLARSLLEELQTLVGDSEYWFPSARTNELASDRARTISKTAREARKLLKIKDWRPHDLRRTARTFMAKLGVREEVAERVLGHGPDDAMVAVYNQHKYLEEMREALSTWASHLQGLVASNRQSAVQG